MIQITCLAMMMQAVGLFEAFLFLAMIAKSLQPSEKNECLNHEMCLRSTQRMTRESMGQLFRQQDTASSQSDISNFTDYLGHTIAFILC